LLGALPEGERSYLISHLGQRHHKHWAEIKDKIEDGIRQCRKKGYVLSIASWRTDINGVAAPLIYPAGMPALALACGGPARLLSRKTMDSIGQRLNLIAQKIQNELHRRTNISDDR
jgi:DNA-binding IclR family transcriptional regulator